MGFSPADSEALLSLAIGLSVANQGVVRIVRCMCMRASVRICPAVTSTFMPEFQNNLAQLFSLRCRRVILKIFTGRLTVKITVGGQMIKWS